MSIFASDTTKTLDVPFALPHTVTLQKLSGKHLIKAATAHLNTTISDVVARGGAKAQKEMSEFFKPDQAAVAEEVAKIQADPLAGYDKYSLMYSGIKTWTFPNKPLTLVPVQEKNADGRDVTVMRIPAIDDLSDEAVEFFAREVMKLTKPELFLTEEEAKATEKETDAASPVA